MLLHYYSLHPSSNSGATSKLKDKEITHSFPLSLCNAKEGNNLIRIMYVEVERC